ncbi:GNAT family N-acetyltransferase [Robertkochia marina]|uniref:GNAT family N-acetyltransferase n=1 Tax=Robertkochia marina TaxID=1227945 RepID=A0A4S3M1J3_9FLAO|nr:GNAT family N-acetyltransferase [Robertkochia marina]THD68058.1 GNAT family N-acetyltransferase [Robertkochia marina]TRZ42657.1 GNAT family N-acetyltransferase [Robertkochia marina]
MSSIRIREIQPDDNEQMAKVLRTVLVEMGVPKVGTAYADPSVDQMYEAYQQDRAVYFVLEQDGEILGGAGVAQLDNYEGPVCELQKMYFLKEVRALGLGQRMIEACIEKAREFQYEQMYIETMPYMKQAQKLYVKNGFKYIDAPMGDTGHSACPVWLLKDL